MSTALTLFVNYVDADVAYATTPADYIEVDLTNDYLIWTAGSTVVKDLKTAAPTEDELNAASVTITDEDVTVPYTLLYDNSHDIGGVYYTHRIKGDAGANKRYCYAFSFDGDTATEPQLEAWDDTNHDSTDKHVLGAGTPTNSWVKAACTTDGTPGEAWIGTALAGNDAARILKLNNGNGSLDELASGESSQELYCNLKVVVPASYATPSVETFILCVRFAWN